MTNKLLTISEVLNELDKIGFGNQAIIVRTKRVELKDFLRSHILSLLEGLRGEEKPTERKSKITLKEFMDKDWEEKLEDRINELIKNEGYNSAIKELNDKLERIKK